MNVDVSVYYNGFHGDLNETFVVGKTTDAASEKLVKATHDVGHSIVSSHSHMQSTVQRLHFETAFSP